MEALWQRRTGKIKIGRLLADLGKSRTGNTEAVVNRQLPLTAIVIKDLLNRLTIAIQ